jgi:hypothetical protein
MWERPDVPQPEVLTKLDEWRRLASASASALSEPPDSFRQLA